MTDVANFSVADGEATPVTHTFVPFRVSSDEVVWMDKDVASYMIGWYKSVLSIKRPSGPIGGTGRNTKFYHRTELPILEVPGTAISGFATPPTVSHRPSVQTIWTIPERTSTQEIINLREIHRKTITVAQFQDSVEGLTLPY